MSKVIVLSADALVGEDLKLLEKMPNFRKYLSGGSRIQAVRSVYPTITYPCHTTMATGVYPERHGIPGNLDISQMINGPKPAPWIWFHDAVQAKDIFTAAKRAGKTTAAVFWPVTGNHPDIDYLVDEYWTQGPEDTIHDAFARSGSSPEVMEIVDANTPLLIGNERKHPGCDSFIMACARDIFRKYTPDLMMIHPADVDGARHGYGLFNAQVDEAVKRTDRWIGMMVQAAIDAGVWEDTDFFLVSDHGQMEIKRSVNLNVLLADAGFIDADETGYIRSWKAYSLSGGMSALIFLKDPSDQETADKVYALLTKLSREGVWGVGRVFTAQEAREQEHFAGDFSFVVETDGYTSFGDACVRPYCRSLDNEDYRFGKATHGYLPAKGPQPVLVAVGPDIARGVVLPQGRLIDEAPTYARILGASLPQAQGKAITEILRAETAYAQDTVTLTPVTRDNLKDILTRLTLEEKQKTFVASNSVSVAQAYAQEECVPLAAYDGETLVGFAMYAMDVEEHEWVIMRLMVTRELQGKGYGRAILSALLRRIQRDSTHHAVLISFEPENDVARRLYTDFGFRDTGKTWDDELIYRLEY